MEPRTIIMNPISDKSMDILLKAVSKNNYMKGWLDGYSVGAGVGIIATVASFALVKGIYMLGTKKKEKEEEN